MNTKNMSEYYMPNIGIGEKWKCKIKIYSDYIIDGDNLSVKKNAPFSFSNVLKKDPVLFYKFSKLQFDQQQIVDFANENGFLQLEHDKPTRPEPFRFWFEEIWYMKLAKELSDSTINKNKKHLLLFFKKQTSKHLTFKIPKHIINLDPHKTITDYSLVEKQLSRKHTFDNQDLFEAADQIVSNIIQDRSEELISFYIKAPDIKSKNAILDLDNLTAALWMQFMQYHLEIIKVKECEQCSTPFISPGREKLFCSNSCKLKFFRNPINRNEIEKRKKTREQKRKGREVK